MAIPFKGRYQKGGFTQTAGTIITAIIPPRLNFYTVLTDLIYLCGTTAHTLTIQLPWAATNNGSTVTTATAAASQAVVAVAADPGAAPKGPNGLTARTATSIAAANDYVVFQMPDGTYYYDTIASVSTLNWTMTNNLPTGGIAAGATVWLMKAAASKDPWTGDAFYSILTTASINNVFQDVENGIVSSHVKNSPILVSSNNATAAGTINWLSAIYSSVA